MTEATTYAQLDTALRQLGFQKKAVPGAPVGYQHRASDTVLLYRDHQPDDIVPQGYLMATRKLLVERGLVEPERWDELLQSGGSMNSTDFLAGRTSDVL